MVNPEGNLMIARSKIIKTRWLTPLVGLLIFAAILSKIELSKAIEMISKMKYHYLLLAIPLIILVNLVKAWRWQIFLKSQRISYSIIDCFLIYATGFFVGSITPGRLGDFVKVLYMKNDGCSLGTSLYSVLLDRLLDVLLLVSIACIGLIFWADLFVKQMMIFPVFLIISIVILLFLVIFRNLSERFFIFLLNPIIPGRFRRTARINVKDFFNEFKHLNSKIISLTIGATIISWAIYFAQLHLLVLSLVINISILNLIIFTSISSLASMIPVSILGIGTRDVVLVFLFSQIGLSKESAIAFSFLILVLLAMNGFMGFLGWLRRPVPLGVVR